MSAICRHAWRIGEYGSDERENCGQPAAVLVDDTVTGDVDLPYCRSCLGLLREMGHVFMNERVIGAARGLFATISVFRTGADFDWSVKLAIQGIRHESQGRADTMDQAWVAARDASTAMYETATGAKLASNDQTTPGTCARCLRPLKSCVCWRGMATEKD